MSDDLGRLRTVRGRQAHATYTKDDLGAAYYRWESAKINADHARAILDELIIKEYKAGKVTVEHIARKAHTSRSVIYRLLHRAGIMDNTQGEEDDHGATHHDHYDV